MFFETCKLVNLFRKVCCSEVHFARGANIKSGSADFDEGNKIAGDATVSATLKHIRIGRPGSCLRLNQDLAADSSGSLDSLVTHSVCRFQFSHEASFGEEDHNVSSIAEAGDSDSMPDLITAVKFGNVEEITKQIHERPEMVHVPDLYDQTPIFWAVRHGNMEVLDLLLQAQATVQGVANKHGYTPLMRAMHYSQIQVGSLLLSHRSDLCACDKFQGTCLHVAATSGHFEAVTWLLSQTEAQPLITHANKEGDTPLHVAIKHRYSKVSYVLLEATANPNSPDHLGRTPLRLALACCDIVITQQLISHRANVNECDANGCTLLISLVKHLLQQKKHGTDGLCIIAAILEARADVEAKEMNSGQRHTALMLSVRSQHIALCTLLGAYSKDVQKELALARTAGFFRFVEVLENCGVECLEETSSENFLQIHMCDIQHILCLNLKIQSALRQNDASLVVEILQQVSSKCLPVKRHSEPALQLKYIFEGCKKSILDTSLIALRKVRMSDQAALLQDLQKSIGEWLEMDQFDPPSLQITVAAAVRRMQGVRLSTFELEDANTKSIIDAQGTFIETALSKLGAVCSTVLEESMALAAFPDPNQKLEIKDLQCKKCMVIITNGQFQEHVKRCRSKLGRAKNIAFQEHQKRIKNKAIPVLRSVVKLYHDHLQDCSDFLVAVRSAHKQCRSKAPDAVIPLQVCVSLLEIAMKLLGTRLACCTKVFEEHSN